MSKESKNAISLWDLLCLLPLGIYLVIDFFNQDYSKSIYDRDGYFIAIGISLLMYGIRLFIVRVVQHKP